MNKDRNLKRKILRGRRGKKLRVFIGWKITLITNQRNRDSSKHEAFTPLRPSRPLRFKFSSCIMKNAANLDLY